MKRDWKSKHLFYHDVQQFDKLVIYLSKFMDKLVNQNQIEKYFYIRYWEGGPHIRLRYLVRDTQNFETIDSMINKYAYKFWENNPPMKLLNKTDYKKIYNESIDNNGKMDRKLRKNATIENIAYIPEIERYGGEEALIVSEDLFCICSQVSTALLNVVDNYYYEKKFLCKILLTFYIIFVFHNECNLTSEEILKMDSYAINFWESKGVGIDKKILEFIQKNITVIKNKNFLNKDFDIYVKKIHNLFFVISTLVSKEQYMGIVSSQIHMFANKMGISPTIEVTMLDFFLREDSD
ncbi:thiopeptide-type bacteriocin biosynthesis domain [Streptococcus pneumoniae]|nr:hypothetical protein [Streptococcus pneumoniae]VQG49388.1 thiopeptide-type bacteriocin biosynthesis domain [Streptococcus pneumoniae]